MADLSLHITIDLSIGFIHRYIPIYLAIYLSIPLSSLSTDLFFAAVACTCNFMGTCIVIQWKYPGFFNGTAGILCLNMLAPMFVSKTPHLQVELQLCGGCCGGDPNMPKLNACQFWARRLVRLAPTYFLTNAIGVALKAAFSTEEFQQFTASQYVQSVLGLTSWSFVAPVGNGLTWTISTMLFFYLCFPVLGPAVQRVPLEGPPGTRMDHVRPAGRADDARLCFQHTGLLDSNVATSAAAHLRYGHMCRAVTGARGAAASSPGRCVPDTREPQGCATGSRQQVGYRGVSS